MTANGTDISDGESLSGSQVVRVYGTNLTPPYFSLWFNGVEYTPLDYGDGYVEYVLQDNGTYEIRNEHDVVMEFSISGVNIPSGLPTRFWGYQKDSVDAHMTIGDRINSVSVFDIVCLNYPYLKDTSHPYYNFGLDGQYPNDADFSFVNCSVNGLLQTDSYRGINVSVIDATKVAYITYQDFIIAVFNYTTTP